MSIFYKRFLLVTAICAGLLIVSDASGYTHIGLVGWLALAFFFTLTLITTRKTLTTNPKSNSRFVTGTMGISGIRMFLCVLFIIFYWVVAGKRDLYFVAYFFILYLFFTMFEITFLAYKLRADKRDEQDSKTN